MQVGDRDGVATAQAGQDRFLWQPVSLTLAVELAAEAVSGVQGRRACPAAGTVRRTATAAGLSHGGGAQHSAGRFGIAGADLLAQIRGGLIGHNPHLSHRRLSMRTASAMNRRLSMRYAGKFTRDKRCLGSAACLFQEPRPGATARSLTGSRPSTTATARLI